MTRWATKDQYERETEEADRLVRPAPKVKPPRRDKRREDARPTPDPDIAGDKDIAKDPDLSMNYKNIGGSVARSIVARFQRESREWDTEKARNKYLQEHPEADPNKHTVKDEELSEHLEIEDPDEHKEIEDEPKGLSDHPEIEDEPNENFNVRNVDERRELNKK